MVEKSNNRQRTTIYMRQQAGAVVNSPPALSSYETLHNNPCLFKARILDEGKQPVTSPKNIRAPSKQKVVKTLPV
jgi:hypothetical protein